MSAEVQALYDKARAELTALNASVSDICTTLKEGCSLDVAYSIIDRFWLPTEANQIKVTLSADFPERNGGAILNAPLSGEVSLMVSVPATVEYLSKAFPEIINEVEEVYKKINDLGTSNPEAVEQFNEFRKQPARFVDWVRDLWYPRQEELVDQEISRWEEMTHESYMVENGEYLLLVDYRSAIRGAQEHLEKELVRSLQVDEIRLGGIKYKTDQLIGLIELILLFQQYLDRKLAE